MSNGMDVVSAPQRKLCTRCGKEPREPNQRWGRKCLSEVQRRRRQRVREQQTESRDQGPRVYRWAKCPVFECPYLADRRDGMYCCNSHGSGGQQHSPDCRRRRTEPR